MATRNDIETTAEHARLREARALWARGESEGFSAVAAEVEALYCIVFGDPLPPCCCKDRIADGLIVIINHLKRNNITMAERKFILKRGVVIHHKGETYTRLNITDKIAAEWSRLYPDSNVWEARPAPRTAQTKKVSTKTTKAAKTAENTQETKP